MWVGAYPRKLAALMFRKGVDELVLGIFGKAFAGRYQVLARDMQPGCTVVFDTPADDWRAAWHSGWT